MNEPIGTELATNLMNLLAEIRGKSDECEKRKSFDKTTYGGIVACIENLISTTRAIRAAFNFRTDDGDEIYLRIYGYLQAISVQQDVVKKFGKLIGTKIDYNTYDGIRAQESREVRRLVVGHPTNTAVDVGPKNKTT